MNLSESGAPCFLTGCRMEEAARRLAWAVVGGRLSHHNAAMQIFAEGTDRIRVAWIADLLPDELAPAIAAMIAQGLAAMKQTLERWSGVPSAGRIGSR